MDAQYWQTVGQWEQYEHVGGSNADATFGVKTMAFIATKSNGNYSPPPSGMHIARCYRLVDMGTQPKTFQGKPTGEARKIMASFELLIEEKMEDGRPFTISKSWFLSMHEKASLRRDLESWRGRRFSPEEEAGFDVSKLLGAYCLLNVTEEQGQDGGTYTTIKAITPMVKGMEKPAPINANFVFDMDDPDMNAFEKFSDKMKDTIKGSREWKARASGHRIATTATTTTGSGFNDMDDDIPF